MPQTVFDFCFDSVATLYKNLMDGWIALYNCMLSIWWLYHDGLLNILKSDFLLIWCWDKRGTQCC